MFFYITLHSIMANKVNDHGWDPFNKRVELFQTWHLCELDPLIQSEAPAQTAKWARQGFSLRGAPSGGSSFGKNETRDLVDPQITFGFPDELLNENSRALFRFDAHYWEADKKGAAKVRALFADSTLEYMTNAWKAANQDEEAAKAAVVSWLEQNWQDIVMGLVGVASPAAKGVLSTFNLLPFVELLAKLALNQGSDYHQMQRYIFDLQGTGDNIKWRVISPSRTYDWITGEGLIKTKEVVQDQRAGNEYETEFRFRVLK